MHTQKTDLDLADPAAVRAELLHRVDKIADVLAGNVHFSDSRRRLAPQTLDALADADLFAMFVAKSFGGLETSLTTASEVVQAVAEHDAAAAWVVMIAAWSNLYVSRFSDEAQKEVFGDNPRARLASVVGPNNTFTEADGGYIVNGRWPFSSGILHDDWAILGGDGRIGLFPVSDLTIEDTWDTIGMRGTGSNTSVANDVFLPKHRTLDLDTFFSLDFCSNPAFPATHRLSPVSSASVMVASVITGAGKAACDLVAQKAPNRAIMATVYKRQSDSHNFTASIGQSAVRVDSARLHLAEAARLLDDSAFAAVAPSAADIAAVRGHAGHAVRTITSTLDDLMYVGGASAFANGNPLGQIWRDVNTGARHAAVNPLVNYEVVGGTRLGVEPIISIG